MTDGRMSVAFESQRETKKGDVAETLDIQVSDELGVRSYDLFSGGERFRLDFAIRIAISKLLARRAGARLQTLIMDEGFGSQDANGRDRLVEAINSIQDDFGLVLVITHIDELREAFPNRIEVVKGPAGSLISVN
jgi:exonuclease SbcC